MPAGHALSGNGSIHSHTLSTITAVCLLPHSGFRDSSGTHFNKSLSQIMSPAQLVLVFAPIHCQRLNRYVFTVPTGQSMSAVVGAVNSVSASGISYWVKYTNCPSVNSVARITAAGTVRLPVVPPDKITPD